MSKRTSNQTDQGKDFTNYIPRLLSPEEIAHPETVLLKFCEDNCLDRMKIIFWEIVSIAASIEYYHKIARHPEAGKFTMPVPDLLTLLKQSRHLPTTPIPGRDGIYREVDVGKIIGYDRAGKNTSFVTLISHPQGRIETAFPGIIELRQSNIPAGERGDQTEESTLTDPFV
jgi:hypothetical protein